MKNTRSEQLIRKLYLSLIPVQAPAKETDYHTGLGLNVLTIRL